MKRFLLFFLSSVNLSAAITQLDVTSFGAKADGITDNAAAFQRAINAAYNLGIGTVVIPGGNQPYNFLSPIRVWTGVSLEGLDRPMLRRNFFLSGNTNTCGVTGERFFIYLYGNNRFANLIVNGNATNTVVATNGVGMMPGCDFITTSGVVDQSQYGDIAIANGPFNYGPSGNTALTGDSVAGLPGQSTILIENCLFFWACGSSIKVHENGSRGVIVRGNRFHEYYDHAVYFSGWPSLAGINTPAIDLEVSGNTFSWPSQTRGNSAFKIRNYTFRTVVANNKFEVPNDTAFEIDTGDDVGGTGGAYEILIHGNTGGARRFLSVNGYPGPAGNYNIKVSGNAFRIQEYFLHGPSSTVLAPAGTFTVSDNTIRSLNPEVSMFSPIRGDPSYGATWDISHNTFYGAVNFVVYGKLNRLNLSGNFAVNLSTNTTFPAFLAVVDGNGGVSGSGKWLISGNHLVNYNLTFFEDSATSTNGGTFGLDQASMIFANNVMWGNVGNNLLDIRSSPVASYSGNNTLSFQNNQADLIPISVPATKIIDSFHISPTTVNYRSGGIVFNGTNNLGAPISVHTTVSSNGHPALIINNGHSFAAGVGTADAEIWGTRNRAIDSTTNIVGIIGFGNEREDTSAYGNIKFYVKDDAGVIQNRLKLTSSGYLQFGPNDTTNPSVTVGGFNPEGVLSKGVGSLHLRTDVNGEAQLYIKRSSTTNTGWVSLLDSQYTVMTNALIQDSLTVVSNVTVGGLLTVNLLNLADLFTGSITTTNSIINESGADGPAATIIGANNRAIWLSNSVPSQYYIRYSSDGISFVDTAWP